MVPLRSPDGKKKQKKKKKKKKGGSEESEKFHIPYRDSKLTRLLQNSFGGSAKTFLLVREFTTAVAGSVSAQDLCCVAFVGDSMPTLLNCR